MISTEHKNAKIVSIYEEYNNRFWDELTKENCSFGCLVKDGPGSALFESNLNKIG